MVTYFCNCYNVTFFSILYFATKRLVLCNNYCRYQEIVVILYRSSEEQHCKIFDIVNPSFSFKRDDEMI